MKERGGSSPRYRERSLFNQISIGCVRVNIVETTEKRGGALIGLSESYDAIMGVNWNWNWILLGMPVINEFVLKG